MNPSGEVDITGFPKRANTTIGGRSLSTSEDKAKITELRETIDSLKTDIQTVSSVITLLNLLHMHGNKNEKVPCCLLLDKGMGSFYGNLGKCRHFYSAAL